jgi:hypothetical protein
MLNFRRRELVRWAGRKSLMRRLLCAVVVFSATVWAADITGTWSGPMEMKKGEEIKADSAYLVLKQSDKEITGTVGPNAEKQLQITKGTVDGDNVYLEAVVEGENKMVFRLKQEGNKLTGEMKAEGPTAPPVSGKMTLEKQK